MSKYERIEHHEYEMGELLVFEFVNDQISILSNGMV